MKKFRIDLTYREITAVMGALGYYMAEIDGDDYADAESALSEIRRQEATQEREARELLESIRR